MSVDAMDTHMGISLAGIRISDFCLCSETDPDILNRVREVSERDGQGEPIVVVSLDDRCEVVVGRHRLNNY